MLIECMDIGFSTEPKFVVPLYRQLHRFGDLRSEPNLRRLAETIHKSKLFNHLHRVKHIPSNRDELLELVTEPTYTGLLYAAFRLVANKRGKTRLGYKDPADVFNLPILAELLPTARFIHVIRDGRDVALSMLKFDWGQQNLYTACRYWARSVSKCRHDGAVLGDRYFELRLEDLVLNTDDVAYSMGEFINRGENPEQITRLVNTINQKKELDTLYGWKRRLNTRQRLVCEAAAGRVLRECHYETEFPEDIRIPRTQSTYYMMDNFVRRVRNRFLRLGKT